MRKGLIQPTISGYGPLLMGIQGRNSSSWLHHILNQEQREGNAPTLVLAAMPILPTLYSAESSPQTGTTNGGLSLSTSVNNQSIPPKTCSWTNLISSMRISSQKTLGCSKLITDVFPAYPR